MRQDSRAESLTSLPSTTGSGPYFSTPRPPLFARTRHGRR
ncbi:hypothetical protein CGRA01v4_04166 [Colletotrichum graminicola]|nr:hypothetical protein CGRA01v4_04166 [Colletotrichum graminicola]